MTGLPTLKIGLNAAALDAAWLVWKSGYNDFCRKNKIKNHPIVEGEDGTFEGGFIAGIEYAEREIKCIISEHAAAHENYRKSEELHKDRAYYEAVAARDAVMKLLPKELKEKAKKEAEGIER